MYSLNQNCIREFANAVSKFGEVRIVLSSTWRTGFAYNRESLPHIKNLQQQLQKYELSIYGKTPVLVTGNREDEIREYIELYDVKQYVIIDDDLSLFSHECNRLLQTDARKGFTAKNGKQMVKMLKF
jgi:hypothetical protein